MDVRCEKCQTEYELDEAKITAAGVTVKCTACGNLFKIRRRTESGNTPAPQPPPLPTEATSDEKLWLIRAPSGDISRFRELTTLQQWIVERKVSRDCEISRTGDAWKKLGDIAELASFFQVVEQAQAAMRQPQGARKPTQPFAPAGKPPARPAPISSGVQEQPTRRVAMSEVSSVPYVQSPAQVATQKLPSLPLSAVMPPPAAPPRSPVRPTTPPPIPQSLPHPGPAPSESWSGPAMPHAHPGDAPDGPRMNRPSAPPAAEPAWMSGGQEAIRRNKRQSTQEPDIQPGQRTVRIQPGSFEDDYEELRPPRSGVPKIMLAVFLVGGLGAAAVWYFFLREKPQAAAVASPPGTPASSATSSAPPVTNTSGAAPVATLDAGTTTAASTPTPDQIYKDALARLAQDTDEGFAAAEKLLESAHVADPAQDAKILATEAIVNVIWAQALLDDADGSTDKQQSDQARAESERKLQRADKFAKDAKAKAPKAPEVLIALADVSRLRKGHTSEIEKILAGLDSPDALYVKGMLRFREGRLADATQILTPLGSAQPPMLRARWRLALLAFAAKQPDAAKAHVDAILAAQPKHARAHGLAERIAAAGTPAVATASSAPALTTTTSSAAADPGTGPISAEAYEGLVRKGDQLAENANCGDAIKYYERALDARPGGVEALTGLGYCYLDRKEYARAVSSFRAALGLSSHYGEALIGMAEAYRFQGQKDDALSYYRKYLETNPNGGKASIAKHAVDELAPPGATTTTSVAPPEGTPASSAAPASTPASSAATVVPPPTDKLPDKPDLPAASSAPPAPPPTPPVPDKIPDAPVPNQ